MDIILESHSLSIGYQSRSAKSFQFRRITQHDRVGHLWQFQTCLSSYDGRTVCIALEWVFVVLGIIGRF